MVVADNGEYAAKCGRACGIGMLENVARAVDDREHAVAEHRRQAERGVCGLPRLEEYCSHGWRASGRAGVGGPPPADGLLIRVRLSGRQSGRLLFCLPPQ